MMKKLKPVLLSEAMHEKVRRAAFKRRISMKEVVEEALKNHYGWNDDSNKLKKEDENDSPSGNKRPSP